MLYSRATLEDTPWVSSLIPQNHIFMPLFLNLLYVVSFAFLLFKEFSLLCPVS